LGVLLLAAIQAPAFFNPQNLVFLLNQAAVLGIVTVGQSIVLVVRGFDLSVGSVAGVMAMSIVLIAGADSTMVPVAVAFGLSIGVLVGLANGWLVAIRRVPPFVATLGMLIVVEGARFAVTNGQASAAVPELALFLGRGSIGPVPLPLLEWLSVVAVVTVLLHFSRYGRYLYATGSNPMAAALSGVPVVHTLIGAYVVSAVCAGLAGVLLTGNVGYVDQSLGAAQNLNLLSITAAVLGGVAFTGGEGNVVDTIAGVLLLVVVSNLIVVLGLPVELQLVAQGGVLLLAVVVLAARQRFMRSR
jgi:ribose/xylose/arabinose/galactoside ABC-type transport system permease subunit